MDGRIFLCAGGLFGFLGVAAGAFGAHALRGKLSTDMLAVFETAARYQLIHALALLFTGLAALHGRSALLSWSGLCFIAGIVLFSGSLYILTLTGVRAWGAVTPFGGLLLLSGWALLTAAAFRLAA